MDCWHCRRTAVGTCRFCGRGVCENDARTHAYILEVLPAVGGGGPRALVVADALFCGICNVRPNPVEVPELGEV